MIKKIFIVLLLAANLFALSFDYETFEATFTQTVKNKSGKKIEYTGKIAAKKPDMALWEYKKPIKKSVYINKDEVIVYEPLLSQAKYLKKKSSVSLESILKNAKKEGENLYSAKDGDVVYKFSVSNDMIERLTYKDSLDNEAEILFSSRKKNVNLPTSTFVFNPPADTDIIK